MSGRRRSARGSLGKKPDRLSSDALRQPVYGRNGIFKARRMVSEAKSNMQAPVDVYDSDSEAETIPQDVEEAEAAMDAAQVASAQAPLAVSAGVRVVSPFFMAIRNAVTVAELMKCLALEVYVSKMELAGYTAAQIQSADIAALAQVAAKLDMAYGHARKMIDYVVESRGEPIPDVASVVTPALRAARLNSLNHIPPGYVVRGPA